RRYDVRVACACLMGMVCLASVSAQAPKDTKPAKRYGIEADLQIYPQATPKEAFASVLKAIDKKRLDYLLAQLADPVWVDERVKKLGGDFAEVVKDAAAKLAEDPAALKLFRQFFREGEWEEMDTTASVKLKDVKERVYFRKVEGRWFLEDRKQAEEK